MGLEQGVQTLKELVAARGYVKGTISRGALWVSDQEKIKSASVATLRTQKVRVTTAFAEYESCNKAILVLDPEDEEDFAKYEDRYLETLSALDTEIGVREAADNTAPANSNAAPSQPTHTPTRLPHIEVPVFGDPSTARAYQLERSEASDPTVGDFLLFLEKRALALENAEPTPSDRPHKAVVNVTAATRITTCAHCAASGSASASEAAFAVC